MKPFLFIYALHYYVVNGGIYALHYYVVNGGIKNERDIFFTFKQ